MHFIQRSLLRRLCLALVFLYPLLSEPRALWAVEQACGVETAASCGMADCPSRHGGVCCCLLRRRMEARHPGLRAFMDKLERAERAADGPGSCFRQQRCDGDLDQAPPAGTPHLAPVVADFRWQEFRAGAGLPQPEAAPDAEPRRILKVPLFS